MARAKRTKKRIDEVTCKKTGKIWVKSTKRTPHCRTYTRTRKSTGAPRKPRAQVKKTSFVADCPAQKYDKVMSKKNLQEMCKGGRVSRQAALLLHPDKNMGCQSLANKLFSRLGESCSKI